MQSPSDSDSTAPRAPVTMRFSQYGTQSIMQSPGDSDSTAPRASCSHHHIQTVRHPEHHAITRRFTQYGTQSIMQSPGDSHSTAPRASCNHHEIHTVRHPEHQASCDLARHPTLVLLYDFVTMNDARPSTPTFSNYSPSEPHRWRLDPDTIKPLLLSVAKEMIDPRYKPLLLTVAEEMLDP